MEGIKTADAILSHVYPKSDFEAKDKAKEKQVDIEITRLKLDGVKELFIPLHPISLMINPVNKFEK